MAAKKKDEKPNDKKVRIVSDATLKTRAYGKVLQAEHKLEEAKTAKEKAIKKHDDKIAKLEKARNEARATFNAMNAGAAAEDKQRGDDESPEPK